MGVVYKAEDTQLRRTVALKFLSSETVGNEDVKARLIREAQASASLDHPNICQVFGIHEQQGQTFIAMAYIDGPALADKIEERPLPLKQALDLAIQIAEGLQEAHEKGIVHRDIKPHNVMLTAKGQIKIMDFGLASLAGRSKLTKSGTTLGTPAYMAPEQLEGRDVDRRADIWALGCVLYEMLTQRTPFDADYEQAIAYGILNEEPEPVTAQRSGLPLDLDRLIARTLAKKPEERWQHADDLLVELRRLRRGLGRQGASVAPVPEIPTEGTTNGPSIFMSPRLALTAAGVFAAGVLLSWLWIRSDPGDAVRRGLPPHRITRLTSDSGLTHQPAISPDGKLVAYSSDRAGSGNFDIWVQQIGGVGAIRRTIHAANETEPSFSPDGESIVFVSERDGGGTYIMDALAGEPRLLIDLAVKGPEFSPDRKYLAYQRKDIQVTPLEDGEHIKIPRAYDTHSFSGLALLWSRDGRDLIYEAREGFLRDPSDGTPEDWWVASLDDLSHQVKTGFWPRAAALGLHSLSITPSSWLGNENRVIFSAGLGQTIDLWTIPISPDTFQATEAPERLTAGGLDDTQPDSSEDGRVVYTSSETRVRLWSVGIGDRSDEEPVRVSSGVADESDPTLSADGESLLFVREGSAWLRNMATGSESLVVGGPLDEAILSPAGDRVVFWMRDEGVTRIVDIRGGPVSELCSECAGPSDWSPDSSAILVGTVNTDLQQIGSKEIVNPQTGERTLMLSHPDQHYVAETRFSPDGRWATFHVIIGPGMRQVFVVPITGFNAIPFDSWIPVTDGKTNCAAATWSPDGNRVFYVSNTEGTYCLYSQELDSRTKRPVGKPFEERHFHDPRWGITIQSLDYEVLGNHVVIPLTERTGNVWMLDHMGYE